MKTLFAFLTYLLPDRMIRTLFLSSLYRQLFNVNALDNNVYHRVNKILNVCERDHAVGLGMELSQSFWNGEELKHIETELSKNGRYVLTEKAKNEMIEEILSKTPLWLRYNPTSMKEDICKMLENHSHLSNVA
jgi:hypothetical protein